MHRSQLDAVARVLATAPSRRQVLRALASGVVTTAGALLTQRTVAAKPWHPSDCAAHPEVCVCSGLGQTCSTYTDCCNAGTDDNGPIKCVDNTCQCCHGGTITCGRYSSNDVCLDPAKSMGLCCINAECFGPDASCVWVGCTPGVDPDCDPSFPYPCPPGYQFKSGIGGPSSPGSCPRPRPKRRRLKRRRSKRRRAR